VTDEVVPFRVGQFVRLLIQRDHGEEEVTGHVVACDAALVTLEGGVTYNMRSRNFVSGEVLLNPV
jgi:hypothetical protein